MRVLLHGQPLGSFQSRSVMLLFVGLSGPGTIPIADNGPLDTEQLSRSLADMCFRDSVAFFGSSCWPVGVPGPRVQAVCQAPGCKSCRSMQSAIAKDGRPIRIHVPDPIPKCPQCEQLYTDDDEYAKPELVVPMKWRSFNDSKKLSTEAELVKVPAATECYRCWDVRRCEEFRDMDAATVKSKRENPEFDEQWTERRRAKATGSEKYSTQRKAKANAVETKKGLFAEDFNEGITYSRELLRVACC